MQPSVVPLLLSLLNLQPKSTLLDPFMGSGTVVIEGSPHHTAQTSTDLNTPSGARQGHDCMGTDASPLAAFIAHHHTQFQLDEEALNDILRASRRVVQIIQQSGYFQVSANKSGESWFPGGLMKSVGYGPFNSSKKRSLSVPCVPHRISWILEPVSSAQL